jgi:hypothetical protein
MSTKQLASFCLFVLLNGELFDIFGMDADIMPGGIPSSISFNIVFDFVIHEILEEVALAGAMLEHRNNYFYRGIKEQYELFYILALVYANDLNKFINTFQKVTQLYGLTMNV